MPSSPKIPKETILQQALAVNDDIDCIRIVDIIIKGTALLFRVKR